MSDIKWSGCATNSFVVEIAVDVDAWVANYGIEAPQVSDDASTYLAIVLRESIKQWMEASGNGGTVKVTHQKR